jgi:amino acid adenylation domain-containing protein
MKGSNIEDIYHASPLQEGLLFETLNAPEENVYFQQLKFRFDGLLDLPAWQRAWQMVIERHQILRTAIVWQDRERPFQVVMKQVKAPWRILDWRDLSAEQQQVQLAEFLKADRKQGFDFSRAPLLRMTLIRLSDEASEFICSHHHVLLDGWSTGIVLKELLSFYQTNGDAPPVLPPSRPYKDFIAWLERQDFAKAETFWRESLKGFNSPTVLPVSSVNGTQSGDGVQQQLDVYVDAETTARLQSFARANSVTLNTLVTGAWALLLGRYSGAADVVFGITASGRPATLEGVQSMVGLFINTLPLRVQLLPDRRVIPWLTELQMRLLDLREYEFSPLVRVHGWSEVPRGLPLFETMVVFDNYPGEVTQQGIKKLGLTDIRSIESASYPLGLVAAPGPRLFLRIGYDSHRFDPAVVERMMGHLRVLLDNMAANGQAKLSEIAMFTDDEQSRMLVGWNSTKRDYPAEVTVSQLFEEQVAASPDALAVKAGDEALTYRELNERSDKLARYLRRKGIGPESRVAVCVERSAGMIVSLLGVLKAGGAYVPIDHNHPAERFQWLLQDSAASLLVTQPHLLESLPPVELEIVSLDRDLALLDHESVDNVSSTATADNLAYVIYTSGSTGRPRAVMVPHRGICNTLLWRSETFGLTTSDRLLSNLPYSFDASVWQIFGPLISGATLVLTKPSKYLDSSYLVEKIVADGITITDFIPSALQVFLDEPGVDRCRSLRHVFSGGEALTGAIRNALFARLGANLHNVYGPTETSVDAAYWTCDPDNKGESVPIGRPIANKQLYVLDERLGVVPIGGTGEIYIGGSGLARGYSGLPALTAEKFVPDPFSLQPGARLYRTGDLGRYRSDGAIEHVGRVDNQVKIRGFRIELDEIEATLELHEDVRDCVVMAREDTPGNKRLVAYVLPRKRVPSPRDLRQFLEGKLPSYMLPAAIVLIQKLPFTLSGKVDRRALPPPDAMDLELDAAVTAPRTQSEGLLAEVWAQLLGVKRVSIHDNFFTLGGHSLLAARVVSRVREAFKTEIPLRAIFEHPTIASLAEVVEAAMKDDQGLQVPAITPFPRNQNPPMSFAQQRLWFIDQLVPGNAFYNMLGAFCLQGRLNVEAMEGALNDLIERHEILRTTFAEVDGELVQVIHPQIKLSLTLIDLTGLPAERRETESYVLAAEEGKQPFELTRGPLVRARLARLTEEDHRLLLTMHHIVSDGWSLGVLLGELMAFYKARLVGVAARMPKLAIQYADYCAWQQRWLQGEALDNQMDYWRRQLHSAPTLLQLPSDRPRASTQSFKGAIHSFAVSSATTEALRRLCRRETATMFMVLLAAFDVLLSRYSRQDDIVIGTPVAGRNRSEFERLIGFFINTLVLRTDLSGNPTFRELVGRVREVSLGAYAHQDLPFEKIVEELHPQRDLSHTPVFQVMFSLQNTPADVPPLPELSIKAMEVDSGSSKFDLTLDLQEADRGLLGWFEYSTDLFSAEYIARMTGHFVTLLEAIAHDCDRKISALTLLTESEQRQLLVEWNATSVDYATGEAFNRLFEQQVERTVDAVAVVCGPGRLSYAELNRRANRLARSLIEQGVVTESIVGVFMHRDLNLMTSILAVLKAGGAYLPLDPEYPAQRNRTIVAQSGARLILTTRECLTMLNEISNTAHGSITPAVLVVEDALEQERETHNLSSCALPDNLAYIIYTSGSTGVPKGVMIHHRGMVNHLWANIEKLSITSSDVLAQTASHCFDISVWQFLAPLIIGGRVQIFPNEITQDPTRLLSEIDSAGVTVFETVPALLQVALADVKAEKLKRPELKSLRWLLPTGEEVPAALCREWFRIYPTIPLMNAYGPSECSDDVTLAPIYEPPDETVNRMSIGRPVGNLQVAILDRELNPVPIGVPGELCVRGAGVGRGYLSLPERTASVFVPDPFSTQTGARMYRSGDRAKYLPDGNIEFLGRMDHQVKVRGHRIELGEIEAALSQVPAVSEAVVIVREDTPGDKRLVAYCACDKEVVTTAELREVLEQRMPNYMVPSQFVLLDALPLSANGKIERQSLPAPGLSQSRQDSYVAPRDNVEIQLCEIWEKLLKVTPIGINDNFFSVGGHSLLALRLVTEVQQYFHRTLALAVLFERGTIKELAKMLREQIASPDSSLVAIQPQGDRTPVFFVHVGSGNVLCYLDLARHLGSDQPFYAIQDPSLTGTVPPFESIEAMAAHYFESIRAAQPSGPYLIGGWSFGGLVAFEIARQLTAAGEEVSLLAILDSGTPEMEREFERRSDDAALLAILAHEMYLPVMAAELRQFEPEERLHFVAGYMQRAGLVFDDPIGFLRRQLEIFKYRSRASQNYEGGPYAGAISLFVAGDRQPEEEQADPMPDLIEGWRKLAQGGFEVFSVTGAHHEIGREPNVQVLAAKLRSCIDRALASGDVGNRRARSVSLSG